MPWFEAVRARPAPTRRAPSALLSLRDQPAANAVEPTQAHTNGDPLGLSRVAPDPRHEGDVHDTVAFSRLSELLTEAAGIFAALAVDPEIHLAAPPDQSVIDGDVSAPATEPLLSTADLARLLSVDERTIRRWRDEGRLPDAVEIGGVVRWDARVVDEWIQGGGE